MRGGELSTGGGGGGGGGGGALLKEKEGKVAPALGVGRVAGTWGRTCGRHLGSDVWPALGVGRVAGAYEAAAEAQGRGLARE